METGMLVILYAMASAMIAACVVMGAFIIWVFVHPESLERKAAEWNAKWPVEKKEG
jgi:hypothetical protein